MPDFGIVYSPPEVVTTIQKKGASFWMMIKSLLPKTWVKLGFTNLYNKMVVAWTSRLYHQQKPHHLPGAVTTGCTQMEVGCRPSGQGLELIGFGKMVENWRMVMVLGF